MPAQLLQLDTSLRTVSGTLHCLTKRTLTPVAKGIPTLKECAYLSRAAGTTKA